MNNETKIRTIISAVVMANMALIAFDNLFDIFVPSDNLAYVVISVIAMFIAWFVCLYNNNDFSEEACQGTGLTRMLKASKKDRIGEDFFNFVEEVEDEEEGEARA